MSTGTITGIDWHSLMFLTLKAIFHKARIDFSSILQSIGTINKVHTLHTDLRIVNTLCNKINCKFHIGLHWEADPVPLC